jgi:hypothetical protein
MPAPTPRTYRGFFSPYPLLPTVHTDGTWLEPEEFAYPKGGFTRRAYARCPDGVLRIVCCSVPDTWFTIPARGTIKGKYVAGFISLADNGGILFTPIEKKP